MITQPRGPGLLVSLWLLSAGATGAWAEDPAGRAPRFFDCAAIVFFLPCPESPTARPAPAPAAPPPAPEGAAAAPLTAAPPAPVESRWAEPTEDGRVYVPPRRVREFLDTPTPETARAYLAWNLERIQTLQRAMAVLETQARRQGLIPEDRPAGPGPGGRPAPAPSRPREPAPLLIRQPLAPAAPPSPAPALVRAAAPAAPQATCAPPPASAPGPGVPDAPGALRTVPVALGTNGSPAPQARLAALYVFATWCPYSARMTPVVAAWARRHPEVAVLGVAMDSPPDEIAALPPLGFPVQPGSQALKQRLGIQAYPTLIVFRGGTPVYTRQGLSTAAELEAITDALAR